MKFLPCIWSVHFQLLQKWCGCCFSPAGKPTVLQRGNPKTTSKVTVNMTGLSGAELSWGYNVALFTHHHTAFIIKVVFHVTLLIIWFQYPSQFSITSHVEASISCQHDQPGAAVPPANGSLNNSMC